MIQPVVLMTLLFIASESGINRNRVTRSDLCWEPVPDRWSGDAYSSITTGTITGRREVSALITRPVA